MHDTTPAAIRNRIKEFRNVPISDIADNPGNWRSHPYAQENAMRGILQQVGIAGAALGYYSARNGGQLTLIDGHLRKGLVGDALPTLITDLTDEEADLVLLTYDPLANLASVQAEAFLELSQRVNADSLGLRDMINHLESELADSLSELRETSAASKGSGEITGTGGPPEMELQPFEHYDYVVLMFRNRMDWVRLIDRFGLRKEAVTLRDGVTRKVGFGRVLDGALFMDLLVPGSGHDAEATSSAAFTGGRE